MAQFENKNKQVYSKKLKIFLGISFAFLLIVYFIPTDEEKDTLSKTENATENQTAEEIELNKNQKLKEQLELEIKTLSENSFDGSVYRGSVQAIQMEVVLFTTWANMIKQAETSLDEENQKLGKRLESKVKQIQASEFPKMRKAYNDAIKSKLWLENIETNITGKGNTTLELTGGIYANNKAKQQTTETLTEILNMLRFKRINYRFTKYDEEYTYYSFDTPSDSEIINVQ